MEIEKIKLSTEWLLLLHIHTSMSCDLCETENNYYSIQSRALQIEISVPRPEEDMHVFNHSTYNSSKIKYEYQWKINVLHHKQSIYIIYIYIPSSCTLSTVYTVYKNECICVCSSITL